MTSSHSLWQPVKLETNKGRAKLEIDGIVPFREKDRKKNVSVNKKVALTVVKVRNNGFSNEFKIAIQ